MFAAIKESLKSVYRYCNNRSGPLLFMQHSVVINNANFGQPRP